MPKKRMRERKKSKMKHGEVGQDQIRGCVRKGYRAWTYPEDPGEPGKVLLVHQAFR